MVIKKYIIRKYGEYRSCWVVRDELVRVTGFSDKYIRKVKHKFKAGVPEWQRNSAVLPVTGESYRWAEIDRVVYFDLEFLPKNVQEKLPTREQIIESTQDRQISADQYVFIKSQILEKIELTHSNEWVDYYRLHSPAKCFSLDKASLLARRFSSIRMLLDTITGNKFIQLGIARKDDMLDVFCRVVSEEGIMKLSNRRVLRRKLMDFPTTKDITAQLEWMISGNYGNTNSKVVMMQMLVDIETGEQMPYDLHLTLILAMYMNISHSNKHRKVQGHSRYCEFLSRYYGGVTPMSPSTFNRYTNSLYYKAMTSLERDGHKATNDKFTPYIGAYKLRYSGSLWAGDSSGSKLGYLADNGKVYTLMCTYIFDVASYKIMGYSIGDSEDGAQVLEALRMAYEVSGTMMAKEFLSDNGGAWSNKETTSKLQRLFNKVRRIAVGNSQANPAERIIYMISEQMRDQFNWLHSGFSGQFKNVGNKANADYMDKKNLPTKQETYAQIEDMISRWNEQVGADNLSPNERYANNINPELKELDARNYRYVFGMHHEIDISYMRGVVGVMWAGKRYEYDIPNYAESLEKINIETGFKGFAKVIVRHDGNEADIYNEADAYIMTLPRYGRTHKAMSEANEETRQAMTELRAKKKGFTEQAEKITAEVAKCLEIMQVGYDNMGSSIRKQEHQNIENEIINKTIKSNRKSAEDAAIDNL